MAKLSVTDVPVKGKRVLVRVDFNVPLDENLNISDESRILGALPTIKYLVENGAKTILCSHLGRPKGKVVPEMSLAPVAKRLAELLPNVKVAFASDSVGEDAKTKRRGIIFVATCCYHVGDFYSDNTLWPWIGDIIRDL